MSAPKRGLGRGLAALLGDSSVPVAGAHEIVRDISVNDIRPNPFQPRKNFTAEALDELKTSIAEYGVLVPVIVRRRDEGYELIAGERRWRACAALMRPTIPAIVRQSDDRQTLEYAIVENLQREDLNPLEEAAGFAYLIEEHRFTQEDVARRLGKSRSAVTNTLRLLSLGEPIKIMVSDGRLSAGHARALLSAPEAMRLELAERAVHHALTVRALERLAERSKTPGRRRAATLRPLSAEERDFERRLREHFGTHVALVRHGRGGRIELRFGNDEDLLRLSDLLLGEQR
jgi:ParB family chromosome partitioning protein